MKKRQIHIVNKYYLPVLAGIETSIAQIYGRFPKDRWSITIHTSADSLQEPNSLKAIETVRGLRVKRYQTFHGLFLPNIPWSRADVVVLNNFSVIPILPLLIQGWILGVLRMRKSIIILAPHGGLTPNWHDFPPFQATVKKFIHSHLGRWLIGQTGTLVHSVAEWERERLLEMGIAPSSIAVIPNGVEDVAFSRNPRISSDAKALVARAGKYVVTISRIYPLKNLETVIAALASMPPDVNLLIVGQHHNGNYYEQLLKRIHNLGLSNRVMFTGAITGADKFYVLKHAQAFIHMSRFEVDPIVVKEAFSQGCIVIAANNTGTARLVNEGVSGFLMSESDSAGLANLITSIVKSPHHNRLKKMRAYNKKTSKIYQWNYTSEQVELLIMRAIPRWSVSYS